jgi:hypothetical protein
MYRTIFVILRVWSLTSFTGPALTTAKLFPVLSQARAGADYPDASL